MTNVIAFDVNETLLDLRALDESFEALLGSASLRPQWFTLMLQVAFTGGLTGQYVDFTTAQRAALAMLAQRCGVPIGQVRLVAAHSWDIAGAIAAGCQAAFVARPGMVLSPIGAQPDIAAPDVAVVVSKILAIDVEATGQ